MSLLVSTLVVFAVVALLLGLALLTNILTLGPGVAAPTITPAATFRPATPTPEPSLTVEPPTAEPTTQPTAGGTHIVQPGESLSTIGLLYGVPWELIAEVNGITGPNYTIVPGQELIIPLPQSACGDYEAYSVKSGDNIIDIAAEFDVDWTELADFNNIGDTNTIHPGDVLCIPQPGWTPLPTTEG